jgi:thiamine pyrophosphokinase
MSSHHVIRDEQEPPVLIFQLNENWQEVVELLGWSPLVLINPDLKDFFDSQQTKFDAFLINQEENDVVSGKDLVYKSANIAVSLLSWLEKKKFTALNIFSTYNLMRSMFDELIHLGLSIPFVFFTEQGKFNMVPAHKFKKWYPKGHEVTILNEDIVKLDNLKRQEDCFQVENDGFIQISIKGNIILMKE